MHALLVPVHVRLCVCVYVCMCVCVCLCPSCPPPPKMVLISPSQVLADPDQRPELPTSSHSRAPAVPESESSNPVSHSL